MKLVSFHSPNSNQKQFTHELRQNVHAYFKEKRISVKGDDRMLVKSVVMLGLYILPFVCILTLNPGFAGAFLLFILSGVAKAGIGMNVMHDSLHGSFSKNKTVNRMMGWSMYLIGSNVFNWKIQHNIFHHAFTNLEGLDEDIKNRWILRFSEHSPLKAYHRFQYIYGFVLYSLMTFSRIAGDFKQMWDYQKRGLIRQHLGNPVWEFTLMLLVKLVYLLCVIGLPVVYTDLSWYEVLVCFMAMHMVAGFIFAIVFQLAHIVMGVQQPLPNPEHETPNEWMVHQLITTADFARNNKLLTWYIGGLNFQVEHHLFPNVCHIHYPEISKIVEATALKYDIPYLHNSTLSVALVSHVKRLKELGGHVIA